MRSFLICGNCVKIISSYLMLTRNGNQALEFVEIYETNAKKKKKMGVFRGIHNSEQDKSLDDKVT